MRIPEDAHCDNRIVSWPSRMAVPSGAGSRYGAVPSYRLERNVPLLDVFVFNRPDHGSNITTINAQIICPGSGTHFLRQLAGIGRRG